MSEPTREVVQVKQNILMHPSVSLEERRVIYKAMQQWPHPPFECGISGHQGRFDKTGRRVS